MIVVTFALPAESGAFVRSLRNVKRDRTTVCGELENRSSQTNHSGLKICALHTGVGGKECENRLRNLLRATQPELLIASGFCGATSDDLGPGDIVIAANASSRELLRKTQAVLPAAVAGRIYSADRIVDDALDRYRVGSQHGAIAVDMESETISRICMEKSIPMLGLRAVSDGPAAPFPVPAKILFDTNKQRTDLLRLFSYIARKPSSIIPLLKFAQQVRTTKAKLANALVAVLRAL